MFSGTKHEKKEHDRAGHKERSVTGKPGTGNLQVLARRGEGGGGELRIQAWGGEGKICVQAWPEGAPATRKFSTCC